MKKSNLIRSDKPHAVNMPAGSNVAQRKGPPKASEPDPATEAPPNIQKVVPTKTPKTERITPPAAKTVRAKATLSRPIEPPVKTAKPKTATAKAAGTKTTPTKATPAKAAKAKPRSTTPKRSAQAQPQAPAPTEPVWEQDNPIKTRIEKLRTRNAQLAEQLQRLQTTPTARGKRP